MKKSTLIMVISFIFCLSLYAQTGKYLEYSSSSCGYFNWGSDWWQTATNHEHRYAESFVYLNFTENLHHPTYLNAALVYSQTSGQVTIDIYIATQRQINIDFQNDPHWHHHWWNGASANLGHYVGRVIADGTGTLASFDIEDWIAANPSQTYYILFDQNDDPNDAALNMAWLGPRAGFEEPAPDQGRVAFWSFDGNVIDESGNDHNGTEHGGVTYASGVIGQALYLDGIDDYITIDAKKASHFGIDGNKSRSISFWIYPETPYYGSIFCLGTESWGQLWSLVQHEEHWRVNGYGESNDIDFDYAFNRNNWTHFVITYDGNMEKVIINNGEFYLEKTMNLNTGDDFDLWLGRSQFGAGNTNLWKGKIDEIRIYDRVLSQTEIKSLYNSGAGKYLTSMSSSCGYFNWGSDWWQTGTNHDLRYAESFIYLNFTDSLFHPTYLNAALVYSQTSGQIPIDIYISTESQMSIDQQSDPHWHHHWWNGNQANPGYHVGQVVVDGVGAMASFNIEDWIANNPSQNYYILLDQHDDAHDAALNLAWLGPPANSQKIMAYYPFDSNADDFNGNGYNGMLHGGIQFETGIKAQAAKFDGMDDWIDIGTDHPFSSGTEEFTIASWYYGIGDCTRSDYNGLVSLLKDNNPIQTQITFGALWENQKHLACFNLSDYRNHDQAGDYGHGYTKSEAPVNDWTFITGTLKNSVLKLYMNGNLVAADSSSQPIMVKGGKLQFGFQSDVYPNRFEGLADELQFYSYALSESEIKKLYGTISTVHPSDAKVPSKMNIFNYPNPFNSSTKIHYEIPTGETVKIKIYSILGQLTRTLKENEFQQPGVYDVTWDGLDNSGNQVSSGIYIIRLETSGQILNKKVVLSK